MSLDDPTVTIGIHADGAVEHLELALDAALQQSCTGTRVVVVQSRRSDRASALRRRLAGHGRVGWIRVDSPQRRATAKNLVLAHCNTDAVTFHHPADLPAPDKVARQVAGLRRPVVLDERRNWSRVGRWAGDRAEVEAVFCGHRVHTPEGPVDCCDPSSLAADLVPNLLSGMNPCRPMAVAAGLFRMRWFCDHGGFRLLACEDQELCNRLVVGGHIVRWLRAPLLERWPELHTREVSHHELRRDRGSAWLAADRMLRGHIAPLWVSLPDDFELDGPRWLHRNPAFQVATRVDATPEVHGETDVGMVSA